MVATAFFDNSTPFIINIHGIGGTSKAYEKGEEPYWVTSEFFEILLDSMVQDLKAGSIRLTFDDGNCSDHSIAAPALESRGLRASFFVLAARLDQKGYLSKGQVRELCAAGFEIGSHGLNHIDWTSIDDTVLARELHESRKILEDITACEVQGAAVPFGRYDRRILDALRRSSYREVFSSDGGPRLTAAWPTPRYSVRRDTNLAHLRYVIKVRNRFLSRVRMEARIRIKAWRSVQTNR